MNTKGEILGTEPLGPLLAKLSLPATLGMMVNGLYNLVDTLYIGRGVGALGIGGLAIAFPLQMLAMALGAMLGIGGASLVSRNLGAGNRERAAQAAGNVIALAFVLGLVLMICGEIFIQPLLTLFGATDNIRPFAFEYLSVVLLAAAFTSVTMAAISLIQAEGRALNAMVAMFIGMGLNIVLDPLFIFTFHMGIQGAAVATLISHSLSFLYVLFFFLSGKSGLKLKLKHLMPDFSVIPEVMALGSTALVRQAAGSVLFIIINNNLKTFGDDMAIASFGVIFRLLMFMLMPVMGVGQGFQPILGYNYGAGNMERVKGIIRLTMGITTALAWISFAVMMLIPRLLISLFNSEPALIQAAVPALRIIILIVPLLGIHVVGSTYFVALGKAVPALLLVISRKVIFLLPMALWLPQIWGLDGVWASFPAADILATTAAFLWMMRDLKARKEGVSP